MGKKNVEKDEEVKLDKKQQKKVSKLQSEIEYHTVRGEKEEAAKKAIQVENIMAEAKKAQGL
jgi:hypothetical protein|eukprot:CAMPEP_0174283708 /NCGR_PEP_ID=MMETSP0809-20121228/4428_1 /TAXON_ID=73025 ORGANISM="Eutreptiella gymnastica-like, Strain CCMP1594" /NCGR_SAMPLE_ID=MMETSP0809 /ASSEMBLY_ACC=CAM_ASM_000658 /LENGTH=61 /DNA_ID=CAMNT_0015378815 /DNA_START=42 /DNA_END=227 /DNA_ORIENTATION=-